MYEEGQTTGANSCEVDAARIETDEVVLPYSTTIWVIHNDDIRREQPHL